MGRPNFGRPIIPKTPPKKRKIFTSKNVILFPIREAKILQCLNGNRIDICSQKYCAFVAAFKIHTTI